MGLAAKAEELAKRHALACRLVAIIEEQSDCLWDYYSRTLSPLSDIPGARILSADFLLTYSG